MDILFYARKSVLTVFFIVGLFFINTVSGQTITTIAGGIGDNMSATVFGRLLGPSGLAADGVGNVYVADCYNYRIRKISPSGIITTFAGSSISAYGGGGSSVSGQALYASIGAPAYLAADGIGNLYFSGAYSVEKIDPSGMVSTIAGVGVCCGGFSGDGSVATAAEVYSPTGIAIDAAGNIYIADKGNDRVRKINSSGIINTIAGGGTVLGDGGPAISANLNAPVSVAVDASGNVYILDQGHGRVRMVNPSGIITTVAGGGPTALGDGKPATTVSLSNPTSIAVSASGNLFIADYSNRRIRMVDAAGIINTVAGNGSTAYTGDGGPATAAGIGLPSGLTFDLIGNMYISDGNNYRVRVVNSAGIISTIAGNGIVLGGHSGDGGPAYLAQFNGTGLGIDNSGDFYFADAGSYIRKIDASGIISTIAGNGITGFSGDGGPAISAELDNPVRVITDPSGNIYICDQGSGHIRKIDASGIITTIAGGGSGGLGDGGPAIAAVISCYDIAIDNSYNVFIADPVHARIRKIDPSGIITTVAGGGVLSGDGIPATAASIGGTGLVTVDNKGNIFFNSATGIRKVDATGIITTLPFAGANSIAADTMGNLYCASNSGVKRMDIYDYVSNIVGNATEGYVGDQGPATASEIFPSSICISNTGHLSLLNTNFIRDVCCMSNIIDKPPVFKGGHAQNFTVCKNSGAVTIDTLMRITDGDVGNTETWRISAAPAHGTLSGFSYSAISTGGIIMPSGLTYKPVTGFTGADYFSIIVNDGTDTFITTVNVNVISVPNTGTISGVSSMVCVGDSITLFDGTPGGVWSCSNSHAVTSSSGVVTGMSPGIDTIIYTVTNMCGATSATHTVTVNPITTVGKIKGVSSVCVWASITLSDSVTGGIWYSASPFITVSSSGIIIGSAPGSATVYYTVSGICGTAKDSTVITVYPLPLAGAISGTTTLCVGGNITLSDPIPGGLWSSGATSVATVGSTGKVTGVAVGGAVISYSVANGCGTASAITIVNVLSSSPINSITGNFSVCPGDTTSLHDATTGGVWSSSLTSVATISSTGLVTGVSPGITAISYTASLGCGVSVATFLLTVDNPVAAGTLGSPPPLCIGATTVLSTTVAGGIWSSSNGHASIVPSGIITGISTGADTISYTVTNSCGTAVAQQTVSVYPVPLAGIITGASTICSGDSILLSDPATGGSWGSSNISVATVNSTGEVKGIAGGSSIISYTVATGCGTAAAAKLITVNAAAGIITGVTTICTGTTSVLSDPVSGGTWSSSTTSVATISSSGVVTGILAGTTIISYTVISGCGLSSTFAVVTIGTLPVIAAISGASAVCSGSATLLSDATIGGIWSSSNTSVVMVGSTGIVTGLAPGTGTINYTVFAPCGFNRVSYTINVESFPSAGIISGSTTLCAGSSIMLSDNIGRGVWSSSNTTIATVSGTGIVSGIVGGSTLINYAVTNSCGTAATLAPVTVNPLPDAGAILGASYVCFGKAITLSDAALGGDWNSNDTTIATVGIGTGVVAGIALGSTVITYSVSNSCGSANAIQPMLVSPLPDAGAISGFTNLCVGAADTLAETLITGTWSSGNLPVASVGMFSGIVTGMRAGNATVFYNVTNSCGTATVSHIITIDTQGVAPITGTMAFCSGKTTVLADLTPGGVWGSANISIATIDSTGAIIGLSPGNVIISYSVTNGCGTNNNTTSVHVDNMPSGGIISGNGNICTGTSTILEENISEGTWSSGNLSIATITTDGRLTGLKAGALDITYTVTNTCGSAIATADEEVIDVPDAGFITGKNVLCVGENTPLSDEIGGGSWTVAANNIALIDNAGAITAIQAGITDVSYTVANSCGANTASIPLTVDQLPYIGSIIGIRKTIVGNNIILSNEIPDGQWSTSDTALAIVSPQGKVSALGAGTVVITYTVYNSSGCAADSTAMITVFPEGAKGNLYRIYPNPARYELTIGWMNEPDVTAEVDIIDMSGRKVYWANIDMPTIDGSTVLNIDKIVSGMYIVTIRSANGFYSGKLVIL